MTTPLIRVRDMASREAAKRKGKQTDKAGAFGFYWRASAPSDAPRPVAEYEFSRVVGRKHRFDFCFPLQKIAVEIEGNAWGVKGGGRHMQKSDLEKYNIAAALGYRVFRFSPAMLERDPVKCVNQVVEALKPPTRKAGIR